MKFMIAGLGSIGRRHLRNLIAAGQSDILLYRTHKSTIESDDELAGFSVETDLHAALAQKPDGVVIANPTSLHLDVAIPAAKAGCHILLEKPISDNLDRVDKLFVAAEQSGSRILVGFQFRYHPGLQKIKAMLNDGSIGRPVSVRTHYGEYLPDWHPYEDYRKSYAARKDMGGGVVLTLTHPFDYLRMLFGDVASLWAYAGQWSDLEIDAVDTAEVGLRFKSGVVGSVHLDYTQRPPRHQMEIIGTECTIQWDHNQNYFDFYQVNVGKWQKVLIREDFERNHMFESQTNHFVEVVKGNELPICTLQDGFAAQKLALAVHQSAETEQMIHFTIK